MNAKHKHYERMLQQLVALLKDEHDSIANLAIASALLNETLKDINWVGFYLYKNNELVLGPFQGGIACMHIPIKKGVCGTCAHERKIYRVDNVELFPGHIACDRNSKSEIVLPLIKEDTLLGVLDIDSPHIARFQEIDEMYLCKFVAILIQSI